MSERDERQRTPAGRADAVERYLEDPAAPPAEEVAALERALAPLRYRERPIELPARRRPARPLAWAAAVALVVLGLSAFGHWVWSWPEGKAWAVLEGPVRSFPVGETLRLQRGEALVLRVARIGWMRVEGAAELELVSTTSNRHRLAVGEGTLRTGLWAPPGSLAIETPAGVVRDLGCAFLLGTDGATTRVDVTSGWVQLENSWGSSLVPAGASSSMVSTRIPSVPVFRDAAPRFRTAVEAADLARDGPTLESALDHARPRDVFTLLTLSLRRPELRDVLLQRAAELSPPPSADLLERALAGERQPVWTWIDDLPLPPPKRWVPNWRDWWPPAKAGAAHLVRAGPSPGETSGGR